MIYININIVENVSMNAQKILKMKMIISVKILIKINAY